LKGYFSFAVEIIVDIVSNTWLLINVFDGIVYQWYGMLVSLIVVWILAVWRLWIGCVRYRPENGRSHYDIYMYY